MAKASLRAGALARRDALSVEHRTAAAQAIAARGLPFETARGTIVAGYSPIRSEIDPIPLMQNLATQGVQLALPVIVARDRPLVFRVFSPGDPLVRGPLGISEPSPAAAAIIPAVVLVPLAAFDRSGHRIGYGAGHYDRTLAQLRSVRKTVAVGIAFAAQEMADVAALSHDAALDYVLTEAETIDFRSF